VCTPGTALRDARRVAELERLRILDTAPEADYDAIATLGAAILRAPVAAVNLVDGERHFTKAIVGMPDAVGGSVPNELSFCAETIMTPEGVLVIEDTHADPQWCDHPLVVGEPRVGFYAGVAVVSRGQRVGVVCSFGNEPRAVSESERAALVALARQTGSQLQLRVHAAEMRDLAVTDSLTGLPNRSLLMDRLEIALAARSQEGSRVGVLFCDVDRFKAINDTWGHDAGDRVLCWIGERLTSAMRAGDTVARIAGDEFVAVCPGLTGQLDLDAVVARVTAATAQPSPIGPVGVSIGAVLSRTGDDAAQVLRRADAAMYLQKAPLVAA
jgi:diguanylate cyclase (GGDEF)-like protein